MTAVNAPASATAAATAKATEATVNGWNDNRLLKPGERLKRTWRPWEPAANEQEFYKRKWNRGEKKIWKWQGNTN